MSKGYFDDYKDTTFGALGGENVLGGGATSALNDDVSSKVDQDGIHAKCYCERCGTTNKVTVEWPEAVIGSLGFMPPNWQVDRATGSLYAYVGCANQGCRTELRLGYTPAELKRLVLSGVEKGVLNQQWVNNQVAAINAQQAARR
jgi:hypothetical protein